MSESKSGLKRGLAALVVAAALVVLGLGIRPEDPEAGMDRAADSTFGGAAILALIGLFLIAQALLKSDGDGQGTP